MSQPPTTSTVSSARRLRDVLENGTSGGLDASPVRSSILERASCLLQTLRRSSAGMLKDKLTCMAVDYPDRVFPPAQDPRVLTVAAGLLMESCLPGLGPNFIETEFDFKLSPSEFNTLMVVGSRLRDLAATPVRDTSPTKRIYAALRSIA